MKFILLPTSFYGTAPKAFRNALVYAVKVKSKFKNVFPVMSKNISITIGSRCYLKKQKMFDLALATHLIKLSKCLWKMNWTKERTNHILFQVVLLHKIKNTTLMFTKDLMNRKLLSQYINNSN